MGFRKYRCGRNTCRPIVALHDAGVRYEAGRETIAVHKKMISICPIPLGTVEHGTERSSQYVQPVDIGWRTLGNMPIQRISFHPSGHVVPFTFIQGFAVAQSLMCNSGLQYDAGGHNWTGKASPAYFVEPHHTDESFRPQPFLILEPVVKYLFVYGLPHYLT